MKKLFERHESIQISNTLSIVFINANIASHSSHLIKTHIFIFGSNVLLEHKKKSH